MGQNLNHQGTAGFGPCFGKQRPCVAFGPKMADKVKASIEQSHRPSGKLFDQQKRRPRPFPDVRKQTNFRCHRSLTIPFSALSREAEAAITHLRALSHHLPSSCHHFELVNPGQAISHGCVAKLGKPQGVSFKHPKNSQWQQLQRK